MKKFPPPGFRASSTITDCPAVIEWIIETILIKAAALMGHGHGKRKLVELRRLLPRPPALLLLLQRLFGRAKSVLRRGELIGN